MPKYSLTDVVDLAKSQAIQMDLIKILKAQGSIDSYALSQLTDFSVDEGQFIIQSVVIRAVHGASAHQAQRLVSALEGYSWGHYEYSEVAKQFDEKKAAYAIFDVMYGMAKILLSRTKVPPLNAVTPPAVHTP